MRAWNRQSLAVVSALAFVSLLAGSPALAAVYYWDVNGATPGAGGASPSGIWATNVANWTTDVAGSSATANWTNTASRAHFSAGGDATGSYTVTIGSPGNLPTTTQEIGPSFKNITIDSGHITFNGGAMTLSSVAFGGGFHIASGASARLGTATITRTGTNADFSYLSGAGTFYTPGFNGWATTQRLIVQGGAWDFNDAASIGTNRTMILGGNAANPAVFQGFGNLTRDLGNAANRIYWTSNGGGGFAARGGQLNVNLISTMVFDTFERIGNGNPLVLGSPTADSLVNLTSNLNLNVGAQKIEVWNPNNVAGNIGRISGVISSNSAAGSLTKVGLGTLELTAANTYSGGTTIDAGTLLMNNTSGSAVGTGSVLVNANGTLGGTGSTTSNVDVAGTLAPGAYGTESLNIGNLTMQPGSTFAVEVGGLNAGAAIDGYDQLNVNGSVNLDDATLDVQVLNFTPQIDDTFYILSNDGVDAVNGTFAGLANDSEFGFGGYKWKIRYNVDFATQNFALGSGNDIAIQIVPIPEPSMLGLLGFGCATLVACRRRRRQAARA